MLSLSRSAFFDGGARFALRLPALDGLALVVRLLAPRQAHGDLDPAVLEVHPHGDERHAALDRLPYELPEFLPVQEQLAPPLRIVIAVTAVAVRVDVDVVDPHFAALDAREAVAEVCAAFADRLDLRAQQRHARLERLEEV